MKYFFLFFFATNIFAFNWKEVTQNNEEIYYIDIVSIKKSKEMVYYWQLSDRYEKKIIEGIAFMSHVSYYMTDCDMGKTKTLSLTFYKDKMAGGGAVYTMTIESPSWSYDVPGSTGAASSEYACNFIK